MNSLERVKCTLSHREPDRIPMYDAFWTDTLSRWQSEGMPKDIDPEDWFNFDIRMMGIDASPRFEPECLADDGETITLKDRFGYVVRKSKTKSRTMHFISHPVSHADDWNRVKAMFRMGTNEPARIDTRTYPFRLDPGPNWAQAHDRLIALQKKQKYIIASAYGPHETILRLRGFEATLYELYDHPDLIEDMAATYTNFLIEVIQRCLNERIRFHGFFMVEDLAGVNGMLFSPEQWRALFKPSVARLGQFLEENDLDFWMHSCGNAEPVFDDLIECGVQVLNPLEAKSGLDVRTLKPRYGEHLTFLGNIDVMTMTASEATIENEIKDKLTVAKKDGGCIYHSDHSVPPDVSLERYKKVLEWVLKYGRY